jgi:hypothetical protein
MGWHLVRLEAALERLEEVGDHLGAAARLLEHQHRVVVLERVCDLLERRAAALHGEQHRGHAELRLQLLLEHRAELHVDAVVVGGVVYEEEVRVPAARGASGASAASAARSAASAAEESCVGCGAPAVWRHAMLCHAACGSAPCSSTSRASPSCTCGRGWRLCKSRVSASCTCSEVRTRHLLLSRRRRGHQETAGSTLAGRT